MGKVIVFVGIDGSGKSAHARKLAYELESRGESVKYLWMRGLGRVFLSFPILALCRLLGITKIHGLKNGTSASEYPFYAYKPLRLLFPWLQFVDSLIYSFILVYRPSSLSYGVTIMDRSVIDTLVDITVDTHAPTASQLFQRFMLALLPKESLVVVLDIKEEVAMNRKKDIFSIHYLKSRRSIYKHLAKRYGWYLISTEMEFKTVHEQLMELITRTFTKV